MGDVSVIVAAAGAGTRFAGPANKIFQPLAGREIFLRSVEIFSGRQDVCEVLLVLSAADIEVVRRRWGGEVARLGATLVVGGATRARSVRNALERVDPGAALVCVHDAVRPCVGEADVDAVFAAARRTGAAILAAPIHGTIKQVGASGTVERTLSREGLWQAQTPQVFDRGVLVEAYRADTGAATDDAQVVEAAGHAVTVVAGDANNIKITTPGDLALAEAILAAT